MSPNGSPTCPRCGKPLPTDSPAGICIHCALNDALKVGEEAGGQELALHDIPVVGQKISYIGDYELLGLIAHGGMGVVYKARQMNLNRLVAVKMLLSGSHASEEYRLRFQQEAKAAAKLNHPNIVPIYEVGEHEGQLYFAMEYVAGRNLAELVREQPLEPERAARYVKIVAEAVEYAHRQGVLHRDLKPSNILIGSDDRPRITDFGLAKEMEADANLTSTGQALGSPGYIPPEQISIGQGKLGPPSDVYSLGAVLYHLLTGRPPLLAGSLADTLRQVIEIEPLSPKKLNPAIPIDLATICLKCLEKSPARRYSSALELADELERFLTGRPILARPVSSGEKFWRWCRRNPAVAGLIGLVMTSLLAGLVGVLWQWSRAERANQNLATANRNLDAANKSLRVSFSRSKVANAEERFYRNDSQNAVVRLAQVLRDDPGQPVAGPRLLSALTFRNWPLPVSHTTSASAQIIFARFSPKEDIIAAICMDGSLWFWDKQGKVISNSWPRIGTNWHYMGIGFDADQKFIFALTSDGRLLAGDLNGGILLSKTSTNSEMNAGALLSEEKILIGIDKSNLITGWSIPEGNLLYSMKDELPLTNVVISPTGKWIAAASSTNLIKIWNGVTGQLVGKILVTNSVPMIFNAQEDELLVSTEANEAILFDWRQGQQLLSVSPGSPVETAQFSSNGSNFVLFSPDKVTMWNAANGRLQFTRKSPCAPIGDSGTYPEHKLALLDNARTVIVLDPQTGERLSENIPSRWPLDALAISADGNRLLLTLFEDYCTIWDMGAGAAKYRELNHEGFADAFAFSPDSKWLATGGGDNVVRIWDTQSWQQIGTPLKHHANIAAIAFSPNGKWMATASSDQTAMIWNLSTHEVVGSPLRHQSNVSQLAFSPDSTTLATGTSSGEVGLWEAQTGLAGFPLLNINPADGTTWARPEIYGLEFSRDGNRLAVACGNGSAKILDSKSGRLLLSFTNSTNVSPVIAVHFSPDGDRLATACMGGTTRIWDAKTGEPITKERPNTGAVICLSLSLDGQKLVAGGSDGGLRVWSATSGALLAETDSVSGYNYANAFSHSSRSFGAAIWESRARVWDANTAAPLTEWYEKMPNEPNRLAFSPNDRWLAVAGHENHVTVIPQYQPIGPVPDWLPQLAEAVAGGKFDTNDIVDTVTPKSFIAFRQKLANASGEDFYSRWVRWFLADRAKRDPYPPPETASPGTRDSK